MVSHNVSHPNGREYGSKIGFAPSFAIFARSRKSDVIYHPPNRTRKNTSTGIEYIVSRIILPMPKQTRRPAGTALYGRRRDCLSA